MPVRYLPQTTPDHLRGTWRDARPARIEAALDGRAPAPDPRVARRGGIRRAPAGPHAAAHGGRPRGGALAGLATARCSPVQAHAPTSVPGSQTATSSRARCSAAGTGCRSAATRRTGDWATYAAFDDGVLLWVRVGELEDGDEPTDRPVLAARPPLEESLASVISLAADCEPRDIVANRLDPWHGAWLHPYAFSDLTVDDDESSEDRLVLDVAYRLGRTFAVPVRAEFTCPDSHTIVMTITDGEGTGSVVETHATPLTAPGDAPGPHGDDRGGRRDVRPVRVPRRPGPGAARRGSGCGPRRRSCGPTTSSTPRASTSCAAAPPPSGRSGCRGGPAAAPGPAASPSAPTTRRGPGSPQPVSSRSAAIQPVVAARSMRATGRSHRTVSPASTTRGSGVRTPGRDRHGSSPTSTQSRSTSHSSCTMSRSEVSG